MEKKEEYRLRNAIMDRADFLRRIRLAVKEFYINDSKLIELGTERPLTHRVALYLEPLFKGKDVDCNYNKYGDKAKRLEEIEECNQYRTTDLIYPDIVIHERGSGDRNNVAVIEIKPSAEMGTCDRMKLQLMTGRGDEGQYKYEFGLFLGFQATGCKCVLFENGQEREPETIDASA